MSSEEDKPPAPPVRLTSNRGGGIGGVVGIGDRGGDGGVQPVDMRPLPKGECAMCIFGYTSYISKYDTLSSFPDVDCCFYKLKTFILSAHRTRRSRPQEEDAEKQNQGLEAIAR